MRRVVEGKRPERPVPKDATPDVVSMSDAVWSLTQQCWDQQPTKRPPASTVAVHMSASLAQYADVSDMPHIWSPASKGDDDSTEFLLDPEIVDVLQEAYSSYKKTVKKARDAEPGRYDERSDFSVFKKVMKKKAGSLFMELVNELLEE